jgi:nicotinate-nucleotide adenylyltransferase
MKIGIFGGTFNPPHNGHRFLVDTVMRRMKFDRMIIVPSYLPPHKDVENNEPTHRLKMTQLAFPEHTVSDMELIRKGKSYTVDTLRTLAAENPGAELYFLCGSDMFLTMEQWREPASIFSLATIITIARERRIYLKLLIKKLCFYFKYRARCRILYVKPVVLSSSDIREGHVDMNYIDSKVCQYIQEHKLYGEDDHGAI